MKQPEVEYLTSLPVACLWSSGSGVEGNDKAVALLVDDAEAGDLRQACQQWTADGTNLAQWLLDGVPANKVQSWLNNGAKLERLTTETFVIGNSVAVVVHQQLADQTGQKPFDQIISEISTALISSDANHTLIHIQDALATLGTYCDTDRCYVFEFAEQVTEMSNTFEWCRTGISPHMDELQNLTDHDLPWFFEQMRTHRVMIVDDVDKLPDEAGDERAEFQREAIYSVICIGMVMGEELIGFVGCDMVDRRRKWTDIDIRRIRLVGDMIANTLQRIYAHEELLNVQRRLETANQLLQSQATLDGLTGIPNRRALDERLHTELRRTLRHQRSLSLMMLDIDHFKSFNDRYGHLKGDEALKCVAKILQQQCQRSTEFVARYGGEEFVIIVADTEFDQVVELGNSIVEAIEAECISHQDSDISSHLTASVGLHFERPNVDERSIDEWVQRMVESADKALYAAKMSGRNQLVSSARAAVLSTDRNRH